MPQSDTAANPISLGSVLDKMPLAHLHWVKPETLHANAYNPNHVAPPELRLLKVSILENGWTQPIVCNGDEVVDGFHRWTLGLKDADVRALTGGLVPIVPLLNLAGKDKATQMMATVRHNRARGVHGVLPMAEIVRSLIDDHGLSEQDVRSRLQMDSEEVERLYDRAGMTSRGSADAFNKGWVPD